MDHSLVSESFQVPWNAEKITWREKAFESNPKIKEFSERLNSLHRALSFCKIYNPCRAELQQHSLAREQILQLISQHLYYLGFTKSKSKLEEESGVVLDLENTLDNESVLLSSLRNSVNEVERFWDLITADRGDGDFTESLEMLEACKYDLGLEENETEEQDINIWDEPPDSEQNIIHETKKEPHHQSATASSTNASISSPGSPGQASTTGSGVSNSNSGSNANSSSNLSLTTSNISEMGDMDDDPSTKPIKAATLNKLVERLTSPKQPDLPYMKTFLMTYQSFTTPATLLNKLIQRFWVPPDAEVETAVIQLRVVNVLRKWIEDHFSDFNSELIKTLNRFVDEIQRSNNPNYAKTINSAINKKLASNAGKKVKPFKEPPPEPKVPKNIFSPSLNLHDLDEEEIARQLTIIEYDYFSQIQPSELLNLSWSKPKLKHKAKNVLRMIHRSNEVSGWVAASILGEAKLRKRSRMLNTFIKICEYLRALNNFSTLMAILAGLNTSAVHRLRFTREELPKRTQETLAEIEILMHSESSYHGYRTALTKINPPCIPYLGVYLTDLTFIEDGNPDYYKTLINFSKRKLIYNVISKVQQYQQLAYTLQPVHQIAVFLNKFDRLDEQELYRLSLQREPRNADKSQLE